jgi:hypothetical protein
MSVTNTRSVAASATRLAAGHETIRAVLDHELARQSAALLEARAQAFRRLMQVVHAGRVTESHDGCAHDPDLMQRCRVCGAELENTK